MSDDHLDEALSLVTKAAQLPDKTGISVYHGMAALAQAHAQIATAQALNRIADVLEGAKASNSALRVRED